MAKGSVIINGKSLRVWDRMAPGSLRRSENVALAEKKLKDSAAHEYFRSLAELVLVYVEGNEGVDANWLLDNLPQDCSALLLECVTATGMKVKTPGEGTGP